MRVALPFLSPRIYAAGVLLEAILGAWLLLGIAPAWSWAITLGFFGLLGTLSLRLGLLGQTSCGCLGKLTLSPWWAFAFDVAATLALLRWRPPFLASGLRAGLPIIFFGAVGFLMVIGTLSSWHGSVPAAVAHIRGETIVADPEVTDVGEGRLGEFHPFSLNLTNYADKTVRIVGGTSDCSCVATTKLPIDIPPKERRSIDVRVRFTGSAGEFRRRFVLHTDDGRLRAMPITVVGRVIE